MISDETLKKATAEADQAIRDSLPAPAECEHEFSPSFQRKMRRTFRKAKYPVIYKLPKYAACFVLVVVLASSTWLTVDAEARAAFFAWVREQYETFIEYRFVGDTTQNDKSKQYELTQLPDGFFETNRMESKGNAVVIYQNGSGKTIQFTYSQGDDSISLFLESMSIESLGVFFLFTILFGNHISVFFDSIGTFIFSRLPSRKIWISKKVIGLSIISILLQLLLQLET